MVLPHGFRRLVFSCLATFLYGIAAAGEPGARGATFLKIGAGPRATGMGEAQTAVANDSYASYWNPAGLAFLDYKEVAMTYQRSPQDVQEQQANVAVPFRGKSAVGAYMVRTSVSSLSGFDNAGNSVGQLDASDAAYGLAYGYRVLKFLSVGGSLKIIQSQLGPSSASSHAFDAGILMKLHPVSLGFVVKNAGPALIYDKEKTKLPETYSWGLGYEKPLGQQHLTLAADYDISPDNKSYFALGQEFWIRRTVALRTGYRSGDTEGSGIRFGLALNVRNIQFSYSISPFGVLGDAHRFGLSYKFETYVRAPAALSSVVRPSLTPLGTDESRSALVQFSTTRSLQAPSHDKLAPPMNLAPPVRIVPKSVPAKAVSKSPSPLPSDVPSLIALGTTHLKGGRFRQATAAFGKALKIEPNNKTALDLMRKTLNEMDRDKKREKGIYE